MQVVKKYFKRYFVDDMAFFPLVLKYKPKKKAGTNDA